MMGSVSSARHGRRSRTLPTLVIALCALLLLTLGGCGVLAGVAHQRSALVPPWVPWVAGTIHPEGTSEVRVGVGQRAQVDLGIGSPSVGDDWGIVSQTDPSVASADIVSSRSVIGGTPAGPPGSSYSFAVEFIGRAPGRSTIRVLHCGRTRIAEGCDQKMSSRGEIPPQEITVIVE